MWNSVVVVVVSFSKHVSDPFFVPNTVLDAGDMTLNICVRSLLLRARFLRRETEDKHKNI